MTRREGDTLIIEAEAPKTCTDCGEVKELRPYGKGGASICFDCAMATPESQEEAVKRFRARILGREPGPEA